MKIKKKLLKFRPVFLVLALVYSLSAYPSNQSIDPTQCHPLGECKVMCDQQQGNDYADFAIPGRECICPACNTIGH